MSIFERLRAIRKYRNLTQADCAIWLKVSPVSYGRKERGLEGGLGPQQIQILLEKTQFDCRWLFGQMEGPIGEADLRLRGPEKTLTQQMIEEIQELRKRTKRLKELDPLAQRVVTDRELRRIVEALIRKRLHFPRILGYLEGLEERSREAAEEPPARKENVG